jgi:beta-galactosidase
MIKRSISIIRLALAILFTIHSSLFTATAQSVAGLFPLEGSGRIVYNFNEGWRFLLGDAKGAEATGFDDSRWEIVCAPHIDRLEPSEASGGRNYQGVCWYRKHFTVSEDMANKLVLVHFEAIMGKQWVYVNGRLVKEHLGGYLPITIDLSAEGVKAGDQCLIAVKADNSDDKNYPPGKQQNQLDFAYHGGMYRDVWLIGKSSIAITDAIERNQVAGGGVFIHFDNISEKKADVFIDVELGSNLPKSKSVTLLARIKDADGRLVKTLRQSRAVANYSLFTIHYSLNNPRLWSPESPYLYTVELQVLDGKKSLDGGIVRMGIRKAEFRGKDGFWLNGKPYHQLVGGNRHQDFAYVGNALPNSQQWRDVMRLKQAGMTIIRAAHYPQDPSFMDACDELGLFIIVPTPGWQFWNKDPKWGEMVHQNTRDIIRRDRNHPCVLMWEPILNETRYPEDFALKALQVTRDEYPWPGRPVAAADMNSAGVKDNYDVLYDWAYNIDNAKYDIDKCIFTREWGEYVDDWYAHNAINRAARGWGEHAQLAAALSLADTYGQMYHGQRQFIGGCLWHPFDHQRGYHPDAYVGGIYDAFRQPKYALDMFKAQSTNTQHPSPNTHFLSIAHEMTQFSPADVTIFTNCDSVRLTALNGWKSATLPVVHNPNDQPNAPVVFKDFWDFWTARNLSYTKKSWQSVKFVAEGIKDGKVVCTVEKMPSRRSTKIRLVADEMGKSLVADGSDFIVVVAEITDDNGNVRRLAREHVSFTVEGEGRIIGDASIAANPRQVEWGTAPVLIRSTHKAGPIRIIAHSTFEGIHAPAADTLTLTSIPYEGKMCYKESSSHSTHSAHSPHPTHPTQSLSEAERRKMLEEVEQQQQDFGIQ